MEIITSKINDSILKLKDIELSLLRLDLIHKEISGNKWFKLKLNIKEAKAQNKHTIVTFGGAYSNHLHATAFSCKENGLKSIGIIRGDELQNLNSTLQDCVDWGMELKFISRSEYRLKNDEAFHKKIEAEYRDCFIIPEGGNNQLGVRGCMEIVDYIDSIYDVIALPIGTSTTMTGLIAGLKTEQTVMGFSALKGAEYLEKEIETSLSNLKVEGKNYSINHQYHFGGFAKHNAGLIEFMKRFEEKNNVELDFVYTAKMMYGLLDMIEQNKFIKGTKILAIHTGGLQGNRGIIQLKK